MQAGMFGLGQKLINSFAFLSDKLVLVAAGKCYYEDEGETDIDTPSLDIYTLENLSDPVTPLRSFSFPELNCAASADRRIAIRRLMIRSDPAPTVIGDPDHPYPFVLDPSHRLYMITLVLEYETHQANMRQTYHFLVPMSTLMNLLPTSVGGFLEANPETLSPKLNWIEWGPTGSRVRVETCF